MRPFLLSVLSLAILLALSAAAPVEPESLGIIRRLVTVPE